MPLESRLFVKTSLVYLLATFVMGTVDAILAVTGRPQPPFVASIHAHLGFVGWLVNVVMGIALWFLPLARERFPETPVSGPLLMQLKALGVIEEAPVVSPVLPAMQLRAEGRLARFLPQWRVRR